jgi:hypothetical protein
MSSTYFDKARRSNVSERLDLGAALGSRPATDVGFDSVKALDPLHRFGGDRRRAGNSEVVEAAADVTPA